MRNGITNPRRIVWVFLSASFVLSAGCNGQKAAPAVPPTPQVEVTTVLRKDVPITQEWIANVDGFVNAQIQPQVSGYLLKQTYREGSFVKSGQVLFEIDTRPLQASLEQAEAQLAQARAQEVRAQQNVDRDRPLAEARAIAESQLDGDVQALQAAQAFVKAQQAQTDLARIYLNFTKVRSPIDGLAGIASSQIGDLVGPTTVLTTVSQIDPVKVYFALGENEYFRFSKVINQVARGVDLSVTERTPVQLILSDGTTYARTGKIILANRQIDPQTGTIRVAASFPNPDGTLRPGQFARLRAQTYVIANALVIPQAAVNEIQGTYQVAVIRSSGKVEIRPVSVGPRVGTSWVIKDGLNAGELVIVQGSQRVRPGMAVQTIPYQPPAQQN